MARPQGGTIHNLRTEYSHVLSDPKGMQLYYIWWASVEKKKKKKIEVEGKRKIRTGVAGEAQTRALSLVKRSNHLALNVRLLLIIAGN